MLIIGNKRKLEIKKKEKWVEIYFIVLYNVDNDIKTHFYNSAVPYYYITIHKLQHQQQLTVVTCAYYFVPIPLLVWYSDHKS